MSTIHTTSTIADALGVEPTSVARVARLHGIGTKIGRDWIFSADEAEKLKTVVRSGPGNPNFARNQADSKKKNRKKTR